MLFAVIVIFLLFFCICFVHLPLAAALLIPAFLFSRVPVI